MDAQVADGGSEACDEVHELEREGAWQGSYQKYEDTFKPKVSAASSTFTQNQRNMSGGKRTSPQRLALSGEYQRQPTHEWEVLVKEKPIKEEAPQEKAEKNRKAQKKAEKKQEPKAEAALTPASASRPASKQLSPRPR